jgi:hypothetical protein
MRPAFPLAVAAIVVSVTLTGAVACGGPGATAPVGMTLADAPETLDLEVFLPPRFETRDPEAHRLSRKEVGLGEDASEVAVFLSRQPYQLLYWFLRVVEDEEEQRESSLTLGDADAFRETMAEYLAAAAEGQGVVGSAPEVRVSFPDIAGGATLGEGIVELDDSALLFDMLWFRSNDRRVFVYTYSWHLAEGNMPLLPIAEEIESRISGLSQ